MSSIDTAPIVDTTITTVTEENNTAHKRAREEDGEADELLTVNAAAAAANGSTSSLAGRPVPPPLKFNTAEVPSAAASVASPGIAPVNSGTASVASPHAPTPMVRIKSRAGFSSPTTPALATAAGGVASLKISSPASPPAGVLALKINSPTAGAAKGSSGPRFGSPTSNGPKSPTRYGSFTGGSSAAATSAVNDPKTRYTTLLSRLLTKDEGVDEEVAKTVSAEVAERLLRVDEPARSERVKIILHHLSDNKNVSLREAVRQRMLTADQLVTMDIKDLMNPDKKKELEDKIMWAEKDRNLKALEEAKKISSSMYKCPKCKKNDCTFYEKQTRSADEPMTQFITCNLCKYNWKIY